MEKEERIKKLQSEVQSLRDLLARVQKRAGSAQEYNGEKKERIDILKRIRDRKIIDDDIPPF